MKMKRHSLTKFVLLLTLIVVFFVLNLLLGTVRIPLDDVLRILVGTGNPEVSAEHWTIWSNIIWSSRVPQALTATVATAGFGL